MRDFYIDSEGFPDTSPSEAIIRAIPLLLLRTSIPINSSIHSN